MENIENLIGKKVREAREKVGMSQKELAANAKCSLTTINRLENGRQFPHSETLKDIANQLKLSYAELFLDRPTNQNTELEDRITNAIKDGFEALNRPPVSNIDNSQSKDRRTIQALIDGMSEKEISKFLPTFTSLVDKGSERIAFKKIKRT